MLVRENTSLAPFTTLNVGGPARYMVEATEECHVIEALEMAFVRELPLFVLGGGSNIVVSDSGFPGVVIRMATRGLNSAGDAREVVNVAAGEPWDSFVQWTVANRLAGVECLSGIPGTAGGTPIQNVGAYGQEVSEVIASVRVVERESGCIMDMSRQSCGFSYRSSVFNTVQRDRFIVLGASFWLRPGGEPRIDYADLRRAFDDRSDPISLSEVRDAVLRIRAAKAMVIAEGDPDCRSVGSFFKNPVVSEEVCFKVEEAARLRGSLAKSESVIRYKAREGHVKLAAAWLIERAGFSKGISRAEVGLSTKHTLALVNRGGASAAQIVAFMREIQEGVRAAFGIDLVPEPVFVGFEDFPNNPAGSAL